jgi:hypothetical protein
MEHSFDPCNVVAHQLQKQLENVPMGDALDALVEEQDALVEEQDALVEEQAELQEVLVVAAVVVEELAVLEHLVEELAGHIHLQRSVVELQLPVLVDVSIEHSVPPTEVAGEPIVAQVVYNV